MGSGASTSKPAPVPAPFGFSVLLRPVFAGPNRDESSKESFLINICSTPESQRADFARVLDIVTKWITNRRNSWVKIVEAFPERTLEKVIGEIQLPDSVTKQQQQVLDGLFKFMQENGSTSLAPPRVVAGVAVGAALGVGAGAVCCALAVPLAVVVPVALVVGVFAGLLTALAWRSKGAAASPFGKIVPKGRCAHSFELAGSVVDARPDAVDGGAQSLSALSTVQTQDGPAQPVIALSRGNAPPA